MNRACPVDCLLTPSPRGQRLMNDYRIFVGAFPEGDLADRVQAVRLRHDARTARITAPHVTLAGTYWRSGPPTPQNEAATIEHLRSIESRLRPFEMKLAGVETFLPDNPVLYLRVELAPDLLAVRRALLQAIGSDKHRHFTPHLTLTMRLAARQTDDLFKQLRQIDWLRQPCGVPIDHLWLMQRGPGDPVWRYIHRVELKG
jgi:2'-5' RNA ligase